MGEVGGLDIKQFGGKFVEIAIVEEWAEQALIDLLSIQRQQEIKDAIAAEINIVAAVERGLQELTDQIEPMMADQTDPVETIRRVVRTYLAFFRKRPEMAELFIQERAAFPLQHRPLYFAMKDEDGNACQRAGLFQKLVDTHRVRPMPAERFFGVIGDLLYGTILTNLLTGRPADPKTQANDVLDVIFHGVLTDGERTVQRKGKR